ncbi:MAG TPA: SMI1/KNR4 family protein [Steroidobacteraceae bacterium]|nr:SMI1/KNR4 family protein [Steroidobacteraceae bacterium]HRX89717.1 SMI1/KNR4 family protein [Steroidobacteraceae bacterium]
MSDALEIPTDFWEDSDYARKEYVGVPPTEDVLTAVEAALGYKLPYAYIALARQQNGGIPKRTNHRTMQRTSWSEDHVAIAGIYSIGFDKPCSLCGAFGSKFWVQRWGYPDIGVYFADCPSAGHDMLCLDYRECGPVGEPCVVHVDQELEYRITHVADNFKSFVLGLQSDDEF